METIVYSKTGSKSLTNAYSRYKSGKNQVKTLQNSRIKAVVFDMDGLMLDTEPIYKRSLQKAAAEYGYQFDEEFFFTIIGRPNAACEKAIKERFGRNFPFEKFRNRWPGLWREEAGTYGIETKPGLDDLLSFLDEKQIPKAIATSSDREQAGFSLATAGLNNHFSHIITGDEIANGKPSPDIYLEAARRLDVPPEQCVALEDSEAGIMSASAAGMAAIMVPDMKQPSVEVRSAACCVVDSLDEAKERIISFIS